jgi:hypothetical protein
MSTAKIDLTTVAAVIGYLGSNNVSDDEKLQIQRCITSASFYWLWKTGKNAVAGVSPLVTPVVSDQWYDGNGNARLFSRDTPLKSITLLEVNGVPIAESTTFGVRGWFIDSSKKSISIRSGGSTRASYGGFTRGQSNIHVVAMAGFDQTPFDIADKATVMVAVNYKRRQWIDQSSQAMAAGAGTITFRDWELPPDVVSVMNNYSRAAIV